MTTITIEKNSTKLPVYTFDSDSSLFSSLWEAYQGTKIFDDLLAKRYDFRPMESKEISDKFLESVAKTQKIPKHLLHNM